MRFFSSFLSAILLMVAGAALGLMVRQAPVYANYWSTPTPTPSITDSGTPTPRPSATDTRTPTPSPTITNTVTPTPDAQASSTPLPTPIPTESVTPTPNPTPSIVGSATPLPTETPSATPTPCSEVTYLTATFRDTMETFGFEFSNNVSSESDPMEICPTPTPTPKGEGSATPLPTPTPQPIASIEGSASPLPTPTPTPSPEPPVGGVSAGEGGTGLLDFFATPPPAPATPAAPQVFAPTGEESALLPNSSELIDQFHGSINDNAADPTNVAVSGLVDLPVTTQTFAGEWSVTQDGANYANGSARPGQAGNIVIYGHNTSSVFGPLRNATIGQSVMLTDTAGSTHRYRISGIAIVGEGDTALLAPTSTETLTLYTCAGRHDSQRLVVRAVPER